VADCSKPSFILLPRILAALLLFLLLTSSSSTGQGSQGWKVPRTPWGDPDFQGIWTTNEMHGVPLERAKEYASTPELTAKDAEARRERTTQGTVSAEGIGNYDRAFRDTALGYTKQRVSTQASLIVDPPDGRLPPLTDEAQQRRAGRGRGAAAGGADVIGRGRPADWTALGAWGRCITRGALTIVEPSGYNNGVQIVQGPGVIAIQKEMIHETRIVPLNAGSHLASAIRQWGGDARGRWEGDTLVVEIRNFDGRAGLNGATRDATLTERFTRLGPTELEYRYTVNDPGTWTRPWTARMTMTLDPSQYELVEYACHEANYSMVNTLSAARAEERAEREGQTKTPGAPGGSGGPGGR
jgi:hypothetical protein